MPSNDESDLLEAQLDATNQLRDRVSDIINCEFEKTDIYLSKWLQMNRYNVKIAETHFRAHKVWRSTNNVDTILEEDLSEVEEHFPILLDGVDKVGCPIMSIELGPFQLKKFLDDGGRDQFVRYIIQKFEKANCITRKQYSKTNGLVHQLVGIIDFGGFSFRQLTSPTLLSVAIELAKVIEANYPCCCKALNIVNAPRVVKILLASIKPFLSQDSASKIKVFNSDTHRWRAALLETIEIHQLPLHLFGTIPK